MKYHLLFSSTLILLSSVLTANATDNKSLKYTINDRSIVFPFSSDPNNVKIDDNWYLNNFAIRCFGNSFSYSFSSSCC